MPKPDEWSENGLFGWDGEGVDPNHPAQVASRLPMDDLAVELRAAHAKVWDRLGKRLPGSTDEDYRAWVEVSERWQAAQDARRGRGPKA